MASNTDLARFPRPNVAVDIAVLTTLPNPSGDGRGSLAVLVTTVQGAPSGHALPGRFLRKGQTLGECVVDVLRIKAGLVNVRPHPKLLRVFDDPGRDPRAWTLSLGHSLTLPPQRLREATGQLFAISNKGELNDLAPPLLFDHNEIVSEAAAAIRERYELLPDPDGLLEDAFTMAELRSLHEAVLGEPLLKDTFRRRMEPGLQPVTESDGSRVLRSDGGRPAQVYVRNQDSPLPATAQRRLLLPRSRE